MLKLKRLSGHLPGFQLTLLQLTSPLPGEIMRCVSGCNESEEMMLSTNYSYKIHFSETGTHQGCFNLSIVLLSYAALPPTRQTSALVFLKVRRDYKVRDQKMEIL